MTRQDMIELAQSRSAINKGVKAKNKRKAEIIQEKEIYFTIKEIAKSHSLTKDQARYIMRNQSHRNVPAFNNKSQQKSYAYGFTQSQIATAFKTQKLPDNIINK